ncbi:hypothetical protein ASE04_28630 [Rhizobium sp. Root708]|nr:hypothetical protein ASE04_28630 [Rhizobium sp. Root708]
MNIDRLMFCELDAQSATLPVKGAGWVVRTSDLRISASAGQAKQASDDNDSGVWQAVPTGLRVRIEHEYRILRRKGISSLFRRGVACLPRSLRRKAWC